MLIATVDIRALLQFGGMLRDAQHVYFVQNLEPTINLKQTRVYIGIYFDIRIGGLIAMCHLTLLNSQHQPRKGDATQTHLVEKLRSLVGTRCEFALSDPEVHTVKSGRQRVLCFPHAQKAFNAECWNIRSSFLQELGLGTDCEHRTNFHISLDYWICEAVRPPPPAVLAAPVEPALPPPDVLAAPVEPPVATRCVGNSASRCFICGDPSLPRPPSQDGLSVCWRSPSRCSSRWCSPRRWWLEGPASEYSDSDLDEPPPPPCFFANC